MTSDQQSGGLSRRDVFGLAAGLALTPLMPALSAAQTAPGNTRLWYRHPAADWNKALPLGNGSFGAMIFGRVAQERIQLSESTFSHGSPHNYDPQGGLAALPEVRRLIDEGRFWNAQDIAWRMMGQPFAQMSYSTFGDLFLNFVNPAKPTEYRRELDISQAVATTTFGVGRRRFKREAFASFPDKVVVMRLEAEAGFIDFDTVYRGPREAHYDTEQYGSSSPPVTTVQADGDVNWLQRDDVGSPGDGVTVAIDGPKSVLITGRNREQGGVPGGLTYAIRVQAVGDGQIVASASGLRVRGAKGVTLLISGATSYVNFEDVSADPVAIVRARTAAAMTKSYAELKRSHLADYQPIFGTLTLDLGHTPTEALPTDRRIAVGETSDDPALFALYVQFGRYLLISSSRAGGQPANIQGIWNEGTNPPWGSKFTININTEMNYWHADPAGLSVCVEPLLHMVEDLMITGARTARNIYGAKGWVAHHNTDIWRGTAPLDAPQNSITPTCGAWLVTTLWTHWDYTRDPKVLNRLYEASKSSCEFFLDSLVEDPKGRGLVTSPSTSPENFHPFGAALCAGPAMDRQILRDLFDATVKAGRLLGRDEDLLKRIEAARARLPADRIGSGGQFQEWLEDWDQQAPWQDHRHVSHLYAVYPSSQINVRDTPDLIEAAKVSLNRRGDLSTGWATAWRACLWARMGDGERAYRILKGLVGAYRTYPNMFDAHPPFQIDGNFGGTAAILETMVQSWGEEIHILSAMPKAWPKGEVRGVRVRGGHVVDLTWSGGRPTMLKIVGLPASTVAVRSGGQRFEAQLDAAGQYTRRW